MSSVVLFLACTALYYLTRLNFRTFFNRSHVKLPQETGKFKKEYLPKWFNAKTPSVAQEIHKSQIYRYWESILAEYHCMCTLTILLFSGYLSVVVVESEVRWTFSWACYAVLMQKSDLANLSMCGHSWCYLPMNICISMVMMVLWDIIFIFMISHHMRSIPGTVQVSATTSFKPKGVVFIFIWRFERRSACTTKSLRLS